MKKTSFGLLLLFFAFSCTGRVEKVNADTVAVLHPDSTKKIEKADSTKKIEKVRPIKSSITEIFPFTDTTYALSLHILNEEEYDEEKNNATVIYTHFQEGEARRIFEDSFYCMNNDYEFRDFNNDHIKDVLIFYYTGGRANPTYHLYLADTASHKLVYVKGFEELSWPELDSVNNIIISYAQAGSDLIYGFYRINSKNKLINLGHGFTTDLGDSVKVERAIHKIIKAYGK